ncbi:hypothetical protein LSM04_001575 [Trypanosoma melophagium]|uniref:uncharacterized protein n=1 Tax=Trypanosoma melophagium TaxID=715481 RepID=UPI003519DF59|nr:hypothetical protein LSM04_001575 [Trypanosoma melophagium]
MISLNFTLHRFVSDPIGFPALPDSERTPFLCEWSPLPRSAHSHAHLHPHGQSGNTPSGFFAPSGDSMALALGSHSACVELDADKDVIVFAVRSAHNQKSQSALARGTLDPVPFLGRPFRSYAIKLRDAAGDVVGRLLFSMEAREGSLSREAMKDTATRGASVDTHSVRRERGFTQDVPKSEGTEKSTKGNGNDHDDDNDGEIHKNINGNKNNDDNRSNTNLKQSHRIMPQKTKDILSASSPYSATTQCNSTETSKGRDRCENRASGNVTGLASANGIKNTDEKDSECLLIDIERIVIKNEAIDLDNPAPLLLGGMYYAKVRYGKNSFCTPAVECRSPKEVIYSHRVSVTEVPNSGDKLRFSLWEDDRQVAGFSLEPSKFRVPVGGHKEYSIPFRYYPTQQASSLEVTVHRINSEKKNNADDGDEGLVLKADVETRQPSPDQPPPLLQELQQQQQPKEQDYEEEASEPPPSLPTRGTIKYPGEKELPLQTNTIPSLASCTGDTKSLVSHRLPSKEVSIIGGGMSAKDYVRKRYSSPTLRQSHWENAVQEGSDSYYKRYQEEEKPIPKYEEEQHQDESKNRTNVAVPPSQNVMLDAREQQEKQKQQHEEELSKLQQHRSLRSQSQHRTGDTLLSCIRQNERRNDFENVYRVQAFLNQISHGNTRSSSATRHPTEGLEVPRLTPNRREPSSRLDNSVDGTHWSERNHTPLRGHLAGAGGSPHKRPDGGRQNSYWSTSDSERRGRSRMAWQHRPAGISEGRSDRTSADVRERLADSLLSRLERPPGFRTSLMEEWLEWREARVSARASRTSSVHSAFSRDDSVASIASRNRASSPLPTKTVADAAEQRPYQPMYAHRFSSIRSSVSGRPPMPMR